MQYIITNACTRLQQSENIKCWYKKATCSTLTTENIATTELCHLATDQENARDMRYDRMSTARWSISTWSDNWERSRANNGRIFGRCRFCKHHSVVRQIYRLNQVYRCFADGTAVQLLGACGTADHVTTWHKGRIYVVVGTYSTHETFTSVAQLLQHLQKYNIK